MNSAVCPNCGSKAVEQHDASGNCVCTECGVVVEENLIVSSVEFVEGAGGASSMVGQFVSATSSKAFTGGPGRGGRFGFSRDSRETILANGRRKIQEVAGRMRLGNHYIDSAHRLFSIAVEKNFVQGRRTTHIVAACLYISCRQEKSQHMLIDFSDALQVNVYTLGACFLRFRRLLGLKLEVIDPALYIYRFAAHLNLDDKANAVALTALRLVGRMKRDWIVMGRRPAGICAAALLIASRAHGFSRDPDDVTRILRVCGLTVNSRVREFEQTQSASLTLDQFHKVNLQVEADPPVFTQNKVKEARARAIQQNNLKLIESGALDHPLVGGKRAARWRSRRMTAKRQAQKDLYAALETDLALDRPKNSSNHEGSIHNSDIEEVEDDEDEQQRPREISNQDENTVPNDPDNRNTGGAHHDVTAALAAAVVATTDSASNVAAGHHQHNNEDEVETEDHGADDTIKQSGTDKRAGSIDISDVVENDSRSVSAVSELDRKPTATTKVYPPLVPRMEPGLLANKLADRSHHLHKAYPRSQTGRSIILPDEANPEERQPPTAPVEARLDFEKWKEEMPSSFREEVDALFRTPTEVAFKEAIFNKINKDYLHLKVLKDKSKAKAETEQTEEDKDLLEQAKGHERYRRKRSREAGGNGSTEEALMEAVANRKISRKINYDAMSAIFDAEGSFSTEGAGNADAEAAAEADEAMFEF